MAAGTVTAFNEFLLDALKGVHNLSTGTLKLGFVDSTLTPAADDATPRWADYSANEVSTAGGYPAGGETLTTVTFTLVSGVPTLAADDVTLAMNASGFTNARWGILYNDTASNDEAIAFVDFGAAISEQAGAISIEWTGGVVAEFPANV